ncbi:MAG: hypothetical protein OHK0022_49160 [Roseiflexaceae bacterium]
MSIIENYRQHLLERYSNYPRGRYVSLLVVRQIESEAIFRTEGSGEPLSKEFVYAGQQPAAGEQAIQRVVMSKRKQTAVERRTGREVLRRLDLLLKAEKGNAVCSLNTNNPCGLCIDCMLYGYAAGGGGAQRSRVITDDAFSLHPAETVTALRQFNALFDNSTMRNPDTGQPSTSIGTDEYVKPGAHFLDIETLKDVTPDELRYVLGNLFRSARYGAISSRIGKVKNILAGVIFSDCELFSNLELTQAVYDRLREDGGEPLFPAREHAVVAAVRQSAEALASRVVGKLTPLSEEETGALREEIATLYADEEALAGMLRRLTDSYRTAAPKDTP